LHTSDRLHTSEMYHQAKVDECYRDFTPTSTTRSSGT
jgi:hypothetical protein